MLIQQSDRMITEYGRYTLLTNTTHLLTLFWIRETLIFTTDTDNVYKPIRMVLLLLVLIKIGKAAPCNFSTNNIIK